MTRRTAAADAAASVEDERSDEDRWSLRVGSCAQQAIALVCHQDVVPTDRYRSRLAVLDATRAVTTGLVLSAPRQIAFAGEVATFSSAYLHRYCPTSPWRLLSSELTLRSSRADLVWWNDDDGRVVLDEIKTGRSRNDHTAAKDQALRHLRGAVEVWGRNVAGVRLLWLSAPRMSQLYTPGKNRGIDLADTPLATMRGGST